MHVLLMPRNYPNYFTPNAATFFKDQADMLNNNKIKVNVISAVSLSIKNIKKNIFLFFKILTTETSYYSYIYIFPSFPFQKKISYFMRKYASKKLFKHYIKIHGKPDIIHIHSFEGGLIADWIKKQYNIPIILTEHSSGFISNYYSNYEKAEANKVFKSCNALFAVSKPYADILEKKLSYKFQVLNNTIDTNFFIPTAPKKNNKAAFTFISIGHLIDVKNHNMLIKAFIETFNNYENILLYIIGQGVLRKELEELVLKNKRSHQIKFIGEIPRKEVKLFLDESDCFVLPSKYETFGVVCIEALSMGIPVIATKSIGPESILTDKKLGKLIENNHEILKKALKEIITEKYNSEYIRNYAVNKYSFEAVLKQQITIYNNFKCSE